MQTLELTLSRMLEEAIKHHQSGRFSEASSIYFEILKIDGRHADSLHLLGVIALQTGKYDLAAQLIRNAIAIKPADPMYYLNFAAVLQRQGKLEESIECYQGALALRPNYVETHNSL